MKKSVPENEGATSAAVPIEALRRIELDVADDGHLVAASNRGIGILSESASRFVVEGEKMHPRLGQEAGTVDDLAFGEVAYVLADETIYALHDNGVPRYEVDLEGSASIVHDREGELLTAATTDNKLVWFDTTKSPHEIARKDVPVSDLQEATLKAGFGWTFVVSGGECFCYKIDDEQHPEVTKIAVEGVSIVDVSMVDDLLVLATSAGVHAFSIPSFDISWKEPDVNLEQLSTPARMCVYGWNSESLFRISVDDGIVADDGPYTAVCPTPNHEGYCVRRSDRIEVYWGSGDITVEVEAEPVALREDTELQFEVQNPTYRPQEVRLDVEMDGLVYRDENGDNADWDDLTVQTTVGGFSSDVVEAGSIRLSDINAEPEISIREHTGRIIVNEELAMAAVNAEISIEGEVTLIDQTGATVELNVYNSGDIPVELRTQKVSQSDSSLSTDETATWTESVEYDPQEGSRHEVTYFPEREDASEVSASTTIEHPEEIVRVDALLDEAGETARLRLLNQSDVTIRDRVRVVTNNADVALEGKIELDEAETTQIWVPVEVRRLAPTRLTIEGEYAIVPEEKFEFTESQELEFTRTFDLPQSRELKFDGMFPANAPIVERLKLRNVGTETLHQVSIDGTDTCTLPRLRPEETADVVRYVRLPEGQAYIPVTEVRVDDSSTTVPAQKLMGWKLNNVEAGVQIVANDNKSALFVHIPNVFSDSVRIEELSIDGEGIFEARSSKNVPPNTTRTFCFDLSDSSIPISREDNSWHIVTVGLKQDQGPAKLTRLQCLASVSEPTYSNEQAVDIQVSTNRLRLRDGVKITVESNSRNLTGPLKIHARDHKTGIKIDKEFGLDQLSDPEPIEVIIRPDSPLKKSQSLVVNVGASTPFGEIDERYRFKNEASKRGNNWSLTHSSIDSKLLVEPEIEPSVDSVKLTQWHRMRSDRD